MNPFDRAVKEVLKDDRLSSIPILFIIQVIMALDDLNLLKESENYDE